MKKMFTRLFSTALLATLTMVGFTVKAQTQLADSAVPSAAITTVQATVTAEVKPEVKATADTKAEVKKEKAAEDTSWKPQRRLWGYAFGDLYYNAHADKANRGGEQMYNGVPQYRNAFQFRRLYLGYDYEINKKFKVEVLLASEPNANTGVNGSTAIQNGDNLVDGKMAFWIKNFNIRVRDLWNGTDFVIGEISTPGFALNEPGTNGPVSLSESTWAYRSIEKTITDVHKNNSYDLGAALQGTFDPATKNFGYVLMVGNNSQASLLGASNPNTGFYKIFYGDIWGKFLDKKLYVDIYADYARTAPATFAIPGQEHNMFKIFAAYQTKPISVGVEAYTQKFGYGVNKAGAAEDATAQGLSIWARGAISKTLNYFARFDAYQPDTKFDPTASYTINTNYGAYNPTVKEQFYTLGLDYQPVKGVHFEPNIWLVDYKDNRNASTAGYVAPDHNLVGRFTVYYVFGK